MCRIMKMKYTKNVVHMGHHTFQLTSAIPFHSIIVDSISCFIYLLRVVFSNPMQDDTLINQKDFVFKWLRLIVQ